MEFKWYVCQKCGNEEEFTWFNDVPEYCSWCHGLDFKLEVEDASTQFI